MRRQILPSTKIAATLASTNETPAIALLQLADTNTDTRLPVVAARDDVTPTVAITTPVATPTAGLSHPAIGRRDGDHKSKAL